MKRREPVFGAVLALALVIVQPMFSQAEAERSAAGTHFLRLKSRAVPTDATDARLLATRATAHRGRIHWIAQMEEGSLDNSLNKDAMAARGISVLGYIPDNGVAISAPANADLSGLGFRWIGTLQASDRRGFPDAAAAEIDLPGYYVAEFYSDVDMGDARAAVFEQQIAIQENPNLLPAQLLIFGTRAQMSALSELDSVVYIFPASDELAQGLPLTACVSAETNYGPLMAMASNLIAGWSSNDQGIANLTYSFGPLSGRLPADTIHTLFEQAQQQWAAYVKITFAQTSNRTGARNIDLGFYSGEHGDAFPFDGPGGVLAHTFYPVPTNSDPIAGDMHMDNDELWTSSASGTDFYAVALHELGHALGLVHTSSPLDVMYPFYRHNITFSPTDISSIQSLYQAKDSTTGPGTPPPPAAPLSLTVQAPSPQVTTASIGLAGTASGGTGTIEVSWSTDRGALGVAQGTNNWTVQAVPLAVGKNTISVTAKDALAALATQTLVVERVDTTPPPPPPPPTSPQPPLIQFTLPMGGSATTTSYTTDVKGTATHPVGIKSVSWRTSTGAFGVAQGTTAWDTGSVGLQAGINTITIDAVSLDGGTASATVHITVDLPAGGGGGADVTPPSLAILTPAGTSVSTSASTITITGTATDNVGVTAVRWETAVYGALATGTTNWSSGPIPLLIGMNNIVIRAYDAAGNSSWRSVTVARQ